MTEFYDLGAHCSVKECREQDFLPFECNLCHLKFCLKHRSYHDHACTMYNETDRTAPVCPLCQQIIPVVITNNESIDRAVDEHIRRGCPKVSKTVIDLTTPTPTITTTTTFNNSNKSKSTEAMCGVKSCNKRGTIKCKSCGILHCIPHRLDIDHQCSHSLSSKNSKKQKTGVGGANKKKSSGAKSDNSIISSMNQKLAEIHRLNRERKEKRQRTELAKAMQLPSNQATSSSSPIALASSSPTSSDHHEREKQPIITFDYQKQSKLFQHVFTNGKHQAIGKDNIEFGDRFFLDVYFPMASRKPPVHMFFHKNWKCGKVLDLIAAQGKINNDNLSISSEDDQKKKLNLFNLCSTELLVPNKSLKELNDDGALQSGDGVILEYGPVLDPTVTEAFLKAVLQGGSSNSFKYPNKSNSSPSSDVDANNGCIVM